MEKADSITWAIDIMLTTGPVAVDAFIYLQQPRLPGDLSQAATSSISENEFLYVTTSNTDGRGNPQKGDDKLIRIDLGIFD